MKLTRLRQLATLAAVLITATPALRAADGSLSFDGLDDFVEVPDFHTLGVTNEVTVEFWAKADVLKQQAAFMLNPDDASNRFQASISYNSGGNMNTYWDFGDIGNGGRVFVANPANTVDNWTHYAFVASQSAATGIMKIYVNGAQVASVNTMDAFETVVSSLRIGGSTGFFFDGSLDEFRVWNVARPQAEIQANLGGPLTGSEAGLRLYFKFDEGSVTTAANSATATSETHPTGTLNGNPTWSTPARKTYVVANASDTGDGSLRAILTTAATDPGPALITFDSSLNGGTITLTGPQDGSALAINDPGGVTIDATSLSAGVTIQRNSGNPVGFRLFRVTSGSSLALTGLTLKDGGGAGGVFFNGVGGGIFNEGTLTLTRCTLSGNSADNSFDGGGGILNTGTLTVAQSTLSGNSADNAFDGGGGGIWNSGTLTVAQSTLSGNSADNALDGGGGGILNTGTLTVTQSTLSGNSAGGSPGGGAILNDLGALLLAQCTLSGNTANNGGAIYNRGGILTLTQCTLSGNTATTGGGGALGSTDSATLIHCTVSGNSAGFGGGGLNCDRALTLSNTIIGNNTAPVDAGPDLRGDGGIKTLVGVNIISSVVFVNGATFGGSGTHRTDEPLLAPLGNYGGPTQTMALRPNSPARNTAGSSTITSDQRGFPIVDQRDIGAYEAGTFTNYNAYIYESLPATGPQHAATFDFDGDGETNTKEWAARTDPASAASVFRVTQTAIGSGQFTLFFPAVAARKYTVQSSPNLTTWSDLPPVTFPATGPVSIAIPLIQGAKQYYYRVIVGDP